MPGMASTIIFGRHAVTALLSNAPDRIQNLYVTPSAMPEIAELAEARGVRIEPFTPTTLVKELEGAVHQGIVARASLSSMMLDYNQFIKDLPATPGTCLVLLNEITDPYNVGAIIRSAAAFGASGILIPSHNQAPITGIVAKASAGTVFSIPIVGINNENQTIEDLKKRKFWIYGLAGEGQNSLSTEKFDAPAVFVVGSEGQGLRHKTREHCDILLRIPTTAKVESLNASVSAAVVLSAWAIQHPEALS
jgi:23S rRNA (guanosine2251-2'-O)-methyltransferase